jgi:hypothetical protein
MPRLLGLLLLIPLAGCAYAPPQLSVTQARITDESEQGVVVTFRIDALNANSVELPLREIHYTLAVGGKPVFYGVRSPEASLRRLGTQQISFPAVIPLNPDQPPPAGKVPYSIDGTLDYTTPGEFAQTLFDTGVRRPSVRFHQSGTIDLSPPSPNGGGAPRSGAEGAPSSTPSYPAS